MTNRRKYVRLFGSDAGVHGGRHDWYSAKKAAVVCIVLIATLVAHAWLADAPGWLSLGLPALIAIVGFWFSGRIRLRFTTGQVPPNST